MIQSKGVAKKNVENHCFRVFLRWGPTKVLRLLLFLFFQNSPTELDEDFPEDPEIQMDLKSKTVKYTKQNHGMSQSEDYEMKQNLIQS